MDERSPAGRLVYTPGRSCARPFTVRRRFRSSNGGDRLPTGQLILVAVAVFLIVLMFGAGRYVIAALAPKPPPGADAPP